MKQILPLSLAITALFTASSAAAMENIDRSIDARSLQVIDKWAECYANTREAKSVMSVYSFEPGYARLVARSNAHRCLFNGDVISASSVQMVGALYVAILRKDPRTEPAVPLNGPDYDGGERIAADPSLQQATNDYFRGASCVVREAPVQSYEFAVGKVNTPNQLRAFEALIPNWAACAPAKPSIQPFTLQALLAWTIARMKGLEPKREVAANA